jgi:hypothetical protein
MAVIFILFFLLAVFFEPALLYYVFSTLQNRSNVNVVNLLYQLYFWLMVSGACLILSQTGFPNTLFYAYPFFLLPQIIENFNSGLKYKWNFWLLFGVGLPKLLYIVYLSFDLLGLFQTRFHSSLILYSLVVLAVEFGILKIQTKWPTFGLKTRNSAQYYSYTCDTADLNQISSTVCSICTERVSRTPLNGNGAGTQQPLMQQDFELTQIMKTPCLHYYHDSCLKEWFKKKLECPNCRQRLPPIESEDN